MSKKLILVISFFIYIVSSVYAWDDKLTHRNLTGTAIDRSIVNDGNSFYRIVLLGLPLEENFVLN